jgi:hypothetical protein
MAPKKDSFLSCDAGDECESTAGSDFCFSLGFVLLFRWSYSAYICRSLPFLASSASHSFFRLCFCALIRKTIFTIVVIVILLFLLLFTCTHSSLYLYFFDARTCMFTFSVSLSLSLGICQGCQMVYFQTKNHNLGKFGRALAIEDGGIFYGHWEYITDIWHIL